MLLYKTEREPEVPPLFDDRVTAARSGSFISLMAGLWFFLTPYAYFGVSEQPVAWNDWIVGAIVVLLAFSRLFWPARSTAASYVNAVLGLWAVLSPWIFGYPDQLGHTINSLSCGATIVAFSLFSAAFTRHMAPAHFSRLIPNDEMLSEREHDLEARTRSNSAAGGI